MKQFLIAGGNPTLLVWNCPPMKKKEIITTYLGKVEQIGFISVEKNRPKLSMMGNEFCVNATLAFSSQLSQSGQLLTSGYPFPIEYANNSKTTRISLPILYKKRGNTVLLPGIGFVIETTENTITKKILRAKAESYTLPAFGAIILVKNNINPYVYVKDTDSFIQETACGSGSIAANIFSGFEKIVQPTGEVISVKQENYIFSIETSVREIPLPEGGEKK